MPDGKITVHVLLDFTKAFDLLNHGLFIHKLGSRYDLHTSAIGMVSSFLRAPRHVHCLLVVPQGCTSSTLFFFLCLSKICVCVFVFQSFFSMLMICRFIYLGTGRDEMISALNENLTAISR
jgi:hypothetical protein